MVMAETALVYGAPEETTDAVFYLGAPSPGMAHALDQTGLIAQRADDLKEMAELTATFATSTLLVPLPRWAEIAHVARADRIGRAVLVAEKVDEADYGYALVALDQGADDVVSPMDSVASLRAIVGPLSGKRVLEMPGLGHVPRLAELSAEVAKIARALEGMTQPQPAIPAPSAPPALNLTAPQVRALIKARRARGQFFPVDLFADPAWDILLDLMASRLEGRQVSVSSLCIAAAVPATTALRWIKSMTDADLLQRKPDPVDGRRVFIDLSSRAVDSMNAYLVGARGVVAV